MNKRRFDRIAEAYLADGPTVLADRVLDAALDEVHLTRQRRVLWRAPWRFPNMNTYAKLGVAAVAAVAVVAVGFLGLNFLAANGTGGVGAPSAAPSPTVAPTATATPTPSAIPDPTAPPLSGQFTSGMHGLTIRYPETWESRPATTPWTSGFLDFGNQSGDVLYEPSNPGNIWLAMASQPLGDRTPAEWEAEVWQYLADDDPGAAACPAEAQPVMIDNAGGVTACNLALVTDAGRGYYVGLYVSDDDPRNVDMYDAAWFASVLARMQLKPDEAVDAAASPAPS